MSWTLEYKGLVKALADWNLARLNLKYVSEEADTAEFLEEGLPFDDPDTFAPGEAITIRQDGVVRFAGKIYLTPATAEGARESRQYEARGPWWDLEETTYMVGLKSYSAGVESMIYCPHYMLNLDQAYNLVPTRLQIIDILNYAITQGVNLQVGEILTGLNLYPFSQEEIARSCAELLRIELSFHPDAQTWIDYTTTPPTINILTKAQIEANAARKKSLDYSSSVGEASRKLTGIEIRSRPDLQRPSVYCAYEITETEDDKERLRVVTDIYPPTATGREIGAWPIVLPIQGQRLQTLKAALEAEPIRADDADETEKNNWWKERVGWLNDSRISDLKISQVSRELEAEDYPNELLSGSIAPWMEVNAAPDTIKGRASFKFWKYPYLDSNGNVTPNNPLLREYADDSVPIHADVTATGAPPGVTWYNDLAWREESDPVPVGLAEYLYNSRKDLQYEGRFTLTELEPTWPVFLGNVVTLIGGRPEWAAMNGLIQTITVNLDSGRTQITFGPPKQLSVETMIALAKVGRRRRRWTNPKLLAEGESAVLQLGRQTAIRDTRNGPGPMKYFRVEDGNFRLTLDARSNSGPIVTFEDVSREPIPLKAVFCLQTAEKYFKLQHDTKILTVDLLSPVWAAAVNKEIAVRELAICKLIDGVPTNRKILALASEDYAAS